MLDFLRKHYKKLLIGLLISLLITFINLIGIDEDYNLVEGTIVDLFNPVFLVVDTVEDWTQQTVQVILNYKQVKEENKRLKKEIATLRYNQQQLEKVMLQNQRLRELLKFKKYMPYQITGASVISDSTDNWSEALIINRGSKAGIKAKMAVVAQEGYSIGRIQRVSQHTAQVVLINDPNFLTGGLIRRKESRDLGVVKGQPKENKLLMTNLAWNADIQVEDEIVTSGLSQHYPKGLPIGEVTSVSPDNYGLTQKATLTPFANLQNIEEVLVITDFNTKEKILLPPLETESKFKQEAE